MSGKASVPLTNVATPANRGGNFPRDGGLAEVVSAAVPEVDECRLLIETLFLPFLLSCFRLFFSLSWELVTPPVRKNSVVMVVVIVLFKVG